MSSPRWSLRSGLLLSMVALLFACERMHTVEAADAPSRLQDAAAMRGDAQAAGERDAATDAAIDAAIEAGADARMDPVDGEDAGAESGGSDMSCAEQIEQALDGIPNELRCIGLYSDVRRKLVAEGVRAYAPAVPLWSDGSGKQRWIWLPEGTTIDASDGDEWQFPEGTKFFKEFRANRRRVETRLFQKTSDGRWVRATFTWNRQETAATRSFGEDLPDITLYGEPYHVPDGRECDQCHEGRRDRILGFSAVSLGLPGATGITLQDLVDEELIVPAPTRTRLRIGDDGTGVAAQALGWLHINCGVSCHNDNQNSEAYSSGLRLKLFAHELDGRPPVDFDPLHTTVHVPAKTKRFGEQERIDPGSPETSLLYQLIGSRSNEREQMPPIATRVVDVEHIRVIETWIREME